jgi:hypothetical protein
MSAGSRKAMGQQNTNKQDAFSVTNSDGEFKRARAADAAASGFPGLIIAIAARTSRLPLMPHHRNRRTGRDGGIRFEPGASASARLARRQTGHGGCRGAVFAWERGAVACVIYSD